MHPFRNPGMIIATALVVELGCMEGIGETPIPAN
jgi:hypothetical protein